MLSNATRGYLVDDNGLCDWCGHGFGTVQLINRILANTIATASDFQILEEAGAARDPLGFSSHTAGSHISFLRHGVLKDLRTRLASSDDLGAISASLLKAVRHH